jgi:4-hydroxybenzoate polyprenyltransferase
MMTVSAGKTMPWKAYFKIIRPLNLLIMAGMLLLVRYAIFLPIFRQNGVEGLMPGWMFLLLILATVFIGAGGYVINDVLDIEMDRINKPDKQLIGKQISEAAGNKLHFNLTSTGVIIGLAFSYLSGNLVSGVIFIIIPTALFYYSYKYKYMPVTGNLVVALLAAMVILICWIFEFYHLKSDPDLFIEASLLFPQILRFVLAFVFFAFMTTFTREIAKDAQDFAGDQRFGCRTIPVILGFRKTGYLILLLNILVITTLAWFQYYLYRSGYQGMVYALVITQILLFYTGLKAVGAKDKASWGEISALMKLVMIAGMLSLLTVYLRSY